ncbi:MAG: hypothetical protein HY806_01480 [Nitrospirae bacterium]|nr:hypothetical protein [Nitrospirota bacterium]
MQMNYPVKVQVIKSKGRPVRLYIALPMALVVAIGLKPGEEVQWELLTRNQLHLIRRPLARKKHVKKTLP